MQSFNKDLLSTCYALGLVLDAADKDMNKTNWTLSFHRVYLFAYVVMMVIVVGEGIYMNMFCISYLLTGLNS